MTEPGVTPNIPPREDEDPALVEEGVERDPDDAANAPNRDPHDDPPSDDLANQSDLADTD